MNQIKPYPIWIGHAGDGTAFRVLFDTGIQAVVQLAIEEPPIAIPRELIYQRFPLFDGAGNSPEILRLAIHAVKLLIESETPTLICCGAGMSRSASITAATLALATQSDFETCIQKVIEDRPFDISPALLADIMFTGRLAFDKLNRL